MAGIDKVSLNFFREGFLPGMTVTIKCSDGKNQQTFKQATIEEIYPFIVKTDKGCFQWKELYIWNNGRIHNA